MVIISPATRRAFLLLRKNQVDANLSNTPYYNGKLSAVKWMSKDATGAKSYERAYNYSYDAQNRYNGETYAERTATSTAAFTVTHGWDESNIVYDKNGNIQSLDRYDSSPGAATSIHIDHLGYTYDTNNDNQLVNVSDGTTAQYTGAGFRNLTGSTGNYSYDSNGSLTADPYKGITSISYNLINRTNRLTITASQYIDYTYSSSGELIRKQAYKSGTTTQVTDYIDGFVYVNSTLSYFPMPEGRVRNDAGTLKQEFVMADQQGNARVSFEDDGSGNPVVRQENSYYGFGLILPNSPVTTPTIAANKQLYNGGSEWQNDYTDLPNYYQTFYRNYDAAIGRFVGVDPDPESAESLSVYNYSGNNPIMYNDPLGNYPPGAYNPSLSNEPAFYGSSAALQASFNSNGFSFSDYLFSTSVIGGLINRGFISPYSVMDSYHLAQAARNGDENAQAIVDARKNGGNVNLMPAGDGDFLMTWTTGIYVNNEAFVTGHSQLVTAPGANQGGGPNEKIYGYYDNTRVGNAYVGGVTGLRFTVSYKLDGEPVKFDVLFDKASFTIHDYKVFGQGVNPAIASTAFVLAYNLAISETAKEIECLGNEGLPINQSSVRAAFLIDINLNLNAFRLGSIFNGGELPFNGSRNIPVTEAKYLP